MQRTKAFTVLFTSTHNTPLTETNMVQLTKLPSKFYLDSTLLQVMLYHLVNDFHVLDDFSAFQDCLTLNMKALQSFAML